MTKPLALAAPLTFDNNEIYMRFPTSTPNFKNLRENHFYYVDKTRYLHNLTEEENYFFYLVHVDLAKAFLLAPCSTYSKEKKSCLRAYISMIIGTTGTKSIL